ncbi:hypothetical protein AAFF_G00347570 [Aldrovandia affinis]|uniref:CDP-diacylglycerol--inositol 3-phosphatidyltransferase n=1 Tax=Aldrovandia affinis TaxID=143900 RepID=A0AAD7WPS8_9TELE|nr:hypothetical protein AAFF_G00347570 [Aldrovandia affinis]
MGLRVLMYAPNVIGYIRVLLVLISWGGYDNPAVFVPCYVISIILDGLDGWVARWLNQTSEFGAWLDVVVDNLGRGMLWSQLFQWGWMVAAVEWCVFTCNHNAHGGRWKSSFSASPQWIQTIMAKGFKTPVGVLAISGLHVLPVWLYGHQHGGAVPASLHPGLAAGCGGAGAGHREIALLYCGGVVCVVSHHLPHQRQAVPLRAQVGCGVARGAVEQAASVTPPTLLPYNREEPTHRLHPAALLCVAVATDRVDLLAYGARFIVKVSQDSGVAQRFIPTGVQSYSCFETKINLKQKEP